MKPTTLIAALIACSLCTGSALAKGGNMPRNNKVPEDEFKKLDTDHNGSLSQEEFIAGGKGNTAEEFKKLDKNGDGKLDRYEFSLKNKKHH
jgi:Ca2+-binding EF-hand superfamily protein